MSAPQQPMVFLPGLCEPAMVWHPMTERLGRNPRNTLAPELPGHRPGDTEASTKSALQSGRWLDDLARRMERNFRGKPAILVGHSTGGMLSIALARRYPHLVQSLVLVGALSSGHRDQTRTARFLTSVRLGRIAFGAAWRLWLSATTTFRQGFLMGASQNADLPLVDEMRRHMATCDPMAVRACARWVVQSCVARDLPHIHAPILALIGQSDPVVPPAHQLQVLRTAPEAQAQLIPGGHLLFAEEPDHVERALRGWLAHGPRAARGPMHSPALAG